VRLRILSFLNALLFNPLALEVRQELFNGVLQLITLVSERTFSSPLLQEQLQENIEGTLIQSMKLKFVDIMIDRISHISIQCPHSLNFIPQLLSHMPVADKSDTVRKDFLQGIGCGQCSVSHAGIWWILRKVLQPSEKMRNHQKVKS